MPRLKFRKTPYLLCVFLVFALAAVNIAVQCSPSVKEWNRERKAVAHFDEYWKTEGAKTFRDVGVEPTEKIYREELDSYLKKFHAANQPLVPEKRIEKMEREFREWWETSGKKSYAANEVSPDEKLYRAELRRYIQGYTRNVPKYQIAYIPNSSSIASLLTSWILSPSVPSFLFFAVGFLLSMKVLASRWGFPQSWIFLAAGTLVSSFVFAAAVSISYFERYGNTPFMGMSLSIAMLLGCAGFGPKREIPKPVPYAAILLVLFDILVNWNFNPNLYGLVAIFDIPFFGLGIFLGNKAPRLFCQKASLGNATEKVEAADPKKSLRKDLDDAIDLANKAEYEHAAQILAEKFGKLFHENPLDTETIGKTVEAILYPHFFFPIPGMQWISWGSEAQKKGLPEVAVRLFEKGASVEEDEKVRRRALFYAGDLRMRHHLDEKTGREELEQVAQTNPTDILATEAKKLLGK